MTKRTEELPADSQPGGRPNGPGGGSGAAHEADLTYWKERLQGAPALLDLPSDRSRQPGRAHEAAHLVRDLPLDLGQSLEACCERELVDPVVALATAFQLLLGRICDQTDFLIALGGRSGVHVLRAELGGDPSGRDVLQRVALAVREAEEHGGLALAQLLRELRPQMEAGAHPLVQVGIAYREEEGQIEPIQELTALETGTLDLVLEVSRSDASGASGAGLSTAFHYDAALFEPATIERMAGHLEVLLRGLCDDPDCRAALLPLLTAPEVELIVRRWNDTARDYPSTSCLHELFEQRLAAAPDALAVLAGGEQLTYAELGRRAHRLAHYLRSAGVGPEVHVGLCVERSVDMAVGILGILEAGGAYVPLDPEYPKDRLAFMLDDSRVSVLVTQDRLVADLPEHGARIVSLDGQRDSIAASPDDLPESGVLPDNLAYVIYTSGSTGRPKGIALRHQGVVNNLTDLNSSFGVGPADRVLAISALSFDMCVYEVLGTLAAGGAIVVPEAAAAHDPAHLAELVVRHQVSVWNSAPALLEMYVDHVESRPELRPTSLRVAIQGGDWEPVTLPGRLKALAPGVHVIVLGGATEASIHSIVFPVESTDPTWTSIPYGVPMRNQRAYVLDAHLQPQPVGVPGELYLAGIGLARGYFERPDLTAERFLPNPLSDVPGDRIYRTGDLVRWKADGNIELLGRIDHQVKIRGHRIELGEIAAVLRDHGDVQDAVVMAHDDGQSHKRLVAYVVPTAEGVSGETDGALVGGDGTQTEQVGHWQKIYDDTYSQSAPGGDETQNFIGWHSSYTGQPFAEEELQELQDGTVASIRALEPKVVREIGCGTGLILFPIAPDCERYDGVDVSPVVIENLKRLTRRPGHELPQVNLAASSADNVESVPAATYDTVIINSVSQHFPSIDYFVKVLAGAVQSVKPGGHVFLGDVRDMRQLETFCTSLESASAPSDVSDTNLRQLVQKRLWQEKELFVDPGLFAALRHHLPAISRVDVRQKRGLHHNEMTMFHYDVVLTVGGEEAAPSSAVPWSDWCSGSPDGGSSSWSLDETKKLLREQSPDTLGLRGVPNARVLSEVAIVERLAGAAGARSAASGEGVDPEQFWALAESLPYTVVVSSSADETGCFDVLLRRNDAPGVAPSFAIEETSAPLPWNRYGNNPLQATTSARLVPVLRTHLQQRLPESMLPSAFVFLDALPLSPNGKLDRKALPTPAPERPELQGEFVEPRSPVEQVLVSIWSDVLGVDRVGIQDDFFELGGHSLTAAKVVSRARESFQVEIPLRSLFGQPTVAGWGESIVATGAAAAVDVPGIAEVLIQLEEMSEEDVLRQLQNPVGDE